MKNVDLKYICKSIGNLSGIPIRLFDNTEEIYRYSVVSLPRDPMEVCREEILAIDSHVGYFVTPRFLTYGVINCEKTKIIIGPSSQVMPSDQSLRELAFQVDVPKDEVGSFLDGMKAIVRMPLESLLLMMCTVNYILNEETLELKDIAIHESEQDRIKGNMERLRAEQEYETSPEPEAHNTLQVEEFLTSIIRKGDTAALKQWANVAPAVRGGVIAVDQLRQLKNTFIVTATLASRAAIRGGMDVNDAFTLSDAYIRQAETLSRQSDILNLQYNMLVEYTERVERVRHGDKPTKLAIEVANYVQHHLSEPVNTEAMANAFYLSRTHFSAKFKKETGMTLTDFILSEKTEEAKRLLRYTDKTVTAISAYLGFSSPGHFSRVFKKYAGLTPQEYRERH